MNDNIKAVLLVGGMGTRLRSVLPDVPKPLAAIGGTTFLDLLVRQLHSQGIRQLVMCTGFRSGQIEEHFGSGRDWDVLLEYSRESEPLGTAGALRLAENYLRTASNFLVMNGDSFLEINFDQFLRAHRRHGGVATMAVRHVDNAARYGTVEVQDHGRVRGFTEKKGLPVSGLINAGIYAFTPEIFSYIPEGRTSLETDVFPRLLDGKLYAARHDGLFIDIGTPDDYARAQVMWDRLQKAAISKREAGYRNDNELLRWQEGPSGERP